MTVSYRLDLLTADGIREVPEQSLTGAWEELRALVERQDPLEGTIVVEVDGQAVLEVGDELWAAAQNLCFAGVSAVLSGERDCLLYRLTSSEGHLVLLPMGHLVRLFGDRFPTVTAPQAELLPDLFDCGLRLLDLYRRVGDDAAHQASYLEPFAEEARRRLEAAGLRKAAG